MKRLDALALALADAETAMERAAAIINGRTGGERGMLMVGHLRGEVVRAWLRLREVQRRVAKRQAMYSK